VKVFRWTYRNVPLLSYWDLARIRDAIVRRKSIHYVNVFNFEISYVPGDNVVNIGSESLDAEDVIEHFEKLKKREHESDCKTVHMVESGRLVRLVLWGGRQYKICQAQERWAPTLLIDGIVMHTLKRDPLDDAREKAILVRPGDRVLDTCACFGYTARACIERGARYVLSVEVDSNVIELSQINPFSRVFENCNVDLVNDSILDVITELRDNSFDAIIHDPPRLTSETGDLYSLELYREFYRILRKGGTLFHYTGAPGSRYRGLDIQRGVCNRLREAGFHIVKVVEGFGVYARKV